MGRIKNYFTADKVKMLHIFLSIYCVILVIAVLPTFIISYNSLSIINKGEEESIAKKLEIISKNMDAAHMRMITYLSSLANNTVLTELSKLRQPLKQEDIMSVYLSIKEINKMYAAYIYSTNSIIEDFVLNYGALDLFIGRSASYAGDFYSSRLFTDKHFNLRSLLTTIENGDSKRIMFLRSPKEGGERYSYYMLFNISRPVQNTSGINAIVKLNEKNISAVMDSFSDDVFTYMLNENGGYLSSGNSFMAEELPGYGILAAEKGVLKIKLRGKNYHLNWLNSSISEWKYVSVTSMENYVKNIGTVWKITIFYTVLFCIAAVAIAYVIFERHYLYLDKINRDSRNLTRDMEIYQNQVSEDRKLIKNNMLFNLINGLIEDDKIENALSIGGINFNYDAFLPVVVYIVECRRLITGQEGREYDLARHTVRSVTMQNLSFNHLFCDIGKESLCILVNFDSSDETAEDMIQVYCDTLRRVLFEQFFVVLNVTSGRIVYDLGDIFYSCREAFFVNNFIEWSGASRIFEKNWQEYVISNYKFPLEMQMNLMHALQKGDELGCKNLLDEIFKMNRTTPVDGKANYLFFDLITTAARTINSLSSNIVSKLYSGRDWADTFSSLKNTEDIKNSIYLLYGNICAAVNSCGGGAKLLLDIRDVTDYIKANYLDVCLTQYSIAEYFGVTCSSISQQFKKKQGINMMDYIHLLRVEKAKELLKLGNMKIQTVTEKAGFGNVKTFIRVFKNMTGVTPGAFRTSRRTEET
jgi:AraC-like DNA-binding protein